jgi:ABC-type branched-subunit amino acid transport system substrate-binding protein
MRKTFIKFWMAASSAAWLPTAGAAPIVGYGSSDTILSAGAQELFYQGFELGLKHRLTRKLPKDFLVTKNVRQDSRLGAAQTARALLDQKVSLVVGFPSSHETLLAAEVTVPAQTLLISAVAGHPRIAQRGPTVFASSEVMITTIKTYLDFLARRFPGKKGLLVHNRAIYSREYAKEISNRVANEKKYAEIRLTAVEIPYRNEAFPADVRDQFAKGGYDYIYLTTWPDDAEDFFQLLESKNIQVPLLTITWTTAEASLLQLYLLSRTGPIYSSTVWPPKSEAVAKFRQLVVRTYGREATPEIGYGYDLGAVVAQVLNRTEGDITRASVLAAFRRQRCFGGTSIGELCFPTDGGQSTRPVFIAVYRPKLGFLPFEE